MHSGRSSTFNLQFNLKLEVKRQKWEVHQGAISTFKLQFDLKLELKRVRPSFSSRVAFSISTFKLQFNLKLELKRVRHLQGYLSQLPRLSSSLTLNWSLNVFDLQDAFFHFHV